MTHPSAEPLQPPPGLTVGGYELLTRLGEGGMGVVHLARRPGGPRVALKVLRPHIVGDDEARQRLEREVGSLSRIRSRWVAEIVDADPWAPVPYVATRYVPGLSLHELVQEEGPVAGEDLWWLARCLADGVTSVHAAGVLHRDVKPSNVLMEGRTPILIDFGLARVADDPRLTHTGWLLGTPGYLAPEILHGEDASPASDVHSWGATVAYAGTGGPPFGRGPSMAVMDRVRRGEHRLDGLPPGLREIVTAALDPDPRRRPTLPTLLAWLDDRGPGAAPPAPVPYDEYTLPLALAAAAHEPTTPLADGSAPAAGHAPVSELRPATRLLTDAWEEEPYDPAWPPEQKVPPAERARRLALLLGAGFAAGAAVTAFPWLALGVLLLLCWLLRSASLAATATGDRRRLRGARWYDPVIYLLGAPWHVVRAIPGTIMLALWSLGLALAAALLCYATAASTTTTLWATGLAFVASLWLGPGGSRVRSPLRRVVNPLAADAGSWIAAVVVLVAAGAFLSYVAQSGPTWTPADGAPLSSLHLP